MRREQTGVALSGDCRTDSRGRRPARDQAMGICRTARDFHEGGCSGGGAGRAHAGDAGYVTVRSGSKSLQCSRCCGADWPAVEVMRSQVTGTSARSRTFDQHRRLGGPSGRANWPARSGRLEQRARWAAITPTGTGAGAAAAEVAAVAGAVAVEEIDRYASEARTSKMLSNSGHPRRMPDRVVSQPVDNCDRLSPAPCIIESMCGSSRSRG